MKNSSKNNFSGKNIKHYKKSSNSDTFSKNENSSKRSNRFLINSAKNKNVNNSNESDKNKVNEAHFYSNGIRKTRC